MLQRVLVMVLSMTLTSILASELPAQTRATSPKPKEGKAVDQEKPAGAGTETKPEESKSAEKPKVELETAVLGGGCFWCLEAVFERIPGVKDVVSGYAGGNVENPSYDMVCSGLTGHAEVVAITFDPSVISFEKLLKVFFASHDPTTLNAQGPDHGTQYRSIILYTSEAQKKTSLDVYKQLTAAKHFRSPIVTQLEPLSVFYPAEPYHQDYYRQHRGAAYCRMYIDPKLKKLKLK